MRAGESSVSYETILFDVADHVATITINRPEAMNSFNRQMMDEFAHAWHLILSATRHLASDSTSSLSPD